MALRKDFLSENKYYYAKVGFVRYSGGSVEFSMQLEIRKDYTSEVLTDPPPTPNVGQFYLLPADCTGDWSGHTGEVAEWDGSAWTFSLSHPENETAGRYTTSSANSFFEIATLDLVGTNIVKQCYEYLKASVENYKSGWTDV